MELSNLESLCCIAVTKSTFKHGLRQIDRLNGWMPVYFVVQQIFVKTFEFFHLSYKHEYTAMHSIFYKQN